MEQAALGLLPLVQPLPQVVASVLASVKLQLVRPQKFGMRRILQLKAEWLVVMRCQGQKPMVRDLNQGKKALIRDLNQDRKPNQGERSPHPF